MSIETIKQLGIPTHSIGAAVQYAMNDMPELHRPGLGDLSKEQYEQNIQQIVELKQCPQFENHKTARLYFGYTVQETVKRTLIDGEDDQDLWAAIQTKADHFIKHNPWSVTDYATDVDSEPKLDANGNPKPKKGAKKELAIKVWNENKHKTMSRKQWIDLLCEQVGMTPAGASTYYANLKSGKLQS